MVDAISLEVFKNLLVSIPEEMGAVLQRAALSPNIRERLDHSCAIFDAQARMIGQAAHIPVHLGSMPASVQYATEVFDQLSPGDVVILNEPYRGGTHLPDITAVTPVFVDGEVAFFVASRAHHADVGGMAPGSLPLSTEIYQEGIIIPPIKVIEAGKYNEAVLKLITANSRSSDERLGDLEAQLAAQRKGAQRLAELVEQHGLGTVVDHASALIESSRRVTEAVIRNIPDGSYSFEDYLEGDGQTHYQISIKVTITVQGSTMTVDFAGSAPQVAGNVNAVSAIVKSAVWYCVRLLVDDDLPMNHGCFEPVTVITPPGSIVNPAFPAAVAVSTTETSQRIVDTVLGALALALPDKIPAASQGSMNNVTFGGMFNRRQYTFYETIGGGHGAGPQSDGLSGRQSHMTNTRNTPVEAIEYVYPVRILSYELRTGSGGKGKFIGGDGIRRVYEFLASATVTLNTERRINQPYGLQGGQPGKSGRNILVRDGKQIVLDGRASIQAQAGDILIIETPGGGGWG